MADEEHRYRLLIVDGDPAVREFHGRLLAQQARDGCDIMQASDGSAGLDALRANAFDCVLLDFNLPDISGLAFLTAAAAAAEGELPCAVVLITGQGSEAIAVEAMKRGAQDYLPKDRVNASSLWRAVTGAIARKGLRQRLARSLRELTEANAVLEEEAAVLKVAEAEIRAAKEAAEQSNEAKTRFVAMVTHELRTPLNGILGYAQLLRIEAGLTTRQDSHVESMMQAGRHLLQMIERVLDFASIESGRMELHPVSVTVREVTEDCIAFIGPMASERGLSLLAVSAHDAPRQIAADPARLRQVLLNLLGNAVKFTDTGGVELRVLAGATAGALRIEVVDTGRGIAEANADRLFQDFERLEAATSVEGTGLGLAIAARIVRLMGGRIHYNANPNGGSVFWFELPPTDLAPSETREAAERTGVFSGRRVLLVDDIAMNLDIIGSFLGAAGHTVAPAESGREAVRLAREAAFDLILMDVRMPEMDGLEATRRIRALDGMNGRVPILALTAYTFPDQVALFRDVGMDGHVAKPVDYGTLIEAIDAVIARRMTIHNGCAALVPLDGVEGDRVADQPAPRFDRAVFDRTVAFLSAAETSAYLQALRLRKQELLGLLERGAEPEPVTEAAHGLTSAAGMFGFLALSDVARHFNRAVRQDAARAVRLTPLLRAECRAALTTLEDLVFQSRIQPP